MTAGPALEAALDRYARAVADATWARDHGTHGDGRPEAADAAAAAARAEVVTLAAQVPDTLPTLTGAQWRAAVSQRREAALAAARSWTAHTGATAEDRAARAYRLADYLAAVLTWTGG